MVDSDTKQTRGLPYSLEMQKLLAEKLLIAADNPKNPKGAGLAFEASKCFAIAFGVPRDDETMKHWLGIAANRGHELAAALVKKLKSSQMQSKQVAKPNQQGNPDPEATTQMLRIRREKLLEEAPGIKMDHIDGFDIYASRDMVEAESIIRNSISEGRDIDSITGNITQSLQGAHIEAKMPLMHWAALTGRTELVKVLLKFGANIDANDPILRATPLAFALSLGHMEAAELLLRHGARADLPDRFGQTPTIFLFAIPPAKFNVLTHLLNHAPKAEQPNSIQSAYHPTLKGYDIPIKETSLSLASKYGNVHAVQAILKSFQREYAEKHYSKAIEYAAANRQSKICDMILSKAINALGSFRALRNPFPSIAKGSVYDLILFHGEHRAEALDLTIQVLSSHGFDINGRDANGETAMCFAVANSAYEREAPSVLLAHGASLDLKTKNGDYILKYAINAVRNSCDEGSVPWLLAQGAPLVAFEAWGGDTDFSQSPLQYACNENALGAAKAILGNSETDVNAPINTGQTPLHLACANNAPEMVQLLLEYHADVFAVDEMKWTPLEQAVDSCSIEVVRYFLDKDLPVHNTSFDPPRSSLDFCAQKSEEEPTRIAQILYRHPRFRSVDNPHAYDSTGHTLLANAVKWQKDDLALELLQAGIDDQDPHASNSAWKCLIEDSTRIDYYNTGDPQQTRQYNRILQAFIDRLKQQNLLEARNDNGETSLHTAANHLNLAAITILLSAGASVHSIDDHGSTPVDSALASVAALHGHIHFRHRPIKWFGDPEPSTDKVVLAILRRLLDAGANSNGGGRRQRPLYNAVMAAWRLNSVACVDLLCSRGADPDLPSGADGLQPLHAALEAPAYLRPLGVSAALYDQDVDGQHARYLETVRGLLRAFDRAGASYQFYPQEIRSREDIAEALGKCNPIALQAMLDEGAGIMSALRTGRTACMVAAEWIGKAERQLKAKGELFHDPSADAWLEERKRDYTKNLRILQEYKSGGGMAGEIGQLEGLKERLQQVEDEDPAADAAVRAEGNAEAREDVGVETNAEVSRHGGEGRPKSIARLARLWSRFSKRRS